MSYISHHIGKRLRMLRGLRSQKEIAKGAGLSPSQYSRYERGGVIPSDEVLWRLAKSLGCKVVDILESDLIPQEESTGKTYHHLGLVLGSRLAFLREKKAGNIEEFAAKVGMPMDKIVKFEMGQEMPDDRAIVSLAKALGVEIEDFLGGAGTAEYFKDQIELIETFADLNDEDASEARYVKYHTQHIDKAAETMKDILYSALNRESDLINQTRQLARENWDLRKQLAEMRALLESTHSGELTKKEQKRVPQKKSDPE